MSSTNPPANFGDIDGPTTRFLSRVAKDIDYLLRDPSTTPTDQRFFKEGVETYRVGQLDVDGTVVTIYSFDAGRVFNSLQKKTDEDGEDVEQFFAADWPIEQASGQSYHSFYFKNRPSESEIRQAHSIHKVKIAIENRELLQEFRCQNCSERVHWTNLTDDCEMTLMERIVMLEKQICNCEGSLDLLRGGMGGEDVIPASEGDAAPREPAASSTD